MARIELADKVIDSAGIKLFYGSYYTCCWIAFQGLSCKEVQIAYHFCSHLCLKYEHNLFDLSVNKAF